MQAKKKYSVSTKTCKSDQRAASLSVYWILNERYHLMGGQTLFKDDKITW